MKPLCVICGRPTQPAAMIGTEAVGPTCAKRLGLVDLVKAGGKSRVTLVKFTKHPVRREPETMDLFSETKP